MFLSVSLVNFYPYFSILMMTTEVEIEYVFLFIDPMAI